ncbi:glycoside hydrolase family 43 protein [Opitutus terrae]|uniref:Glycoside hydrolase family 43 n=1 Tax=Opitutus terrae (strain DSM 11246 / JCM 15787 / PB90-1) TaxID=452637 RepID=B1ZPA5_OPITP|nr:glycoside hydrolase family 43 protein [Opitutus terrae]ACB77594.1 glycoside hydrolase family 43 [Opitutus terrae PB90-1]
MKPQPSTLFAIAAFSLAASSFAAAPAPVAFDSFEYTGRDDIFAAPLPAGHYRNPILAGFYPDPSVCQVGQDYYLINSTFAYYPGIPIFHSRDLVNWRQIGHVIHRPNQLSYDKLGVSRGLFAPALSYHEPSKTFYVVCTLVDGGGNFFVTAQDPAGPWSDPVWLDFDGIDPSLFFDDNGRAWLVNNGNPPDNKPIYQGHRAIWIQEFDVKAQKLIGPRSIIINGGVDLAKQPVWIEGPHLYQRGGWYYLCCAEGGTSDQHSQVIFRSKAPTGPFTPWSDNPILTQRDLDGTVPHAVTATGHADLVEGPDGQWWSVFLACRPFAGRYFTTGRETFLLPVKWTEDGWPRILPHGERVPYVVKAPVGPALAAGREQPNSAAAADKRQPYDDVPLTGNFTWRDDFDSATLSPLWIMVRAPKETWWQLGQPAGRLSLTPRADALSGTGNPSFLARRVQHAKFETSTTLVPPATVGTSGGLVAFQSETHYYYFGVRRTSDGLVLFLELMNGPTPEIVATTKLDAAADAPITLRLVGNEMTLGFDYRVSNGEWKSFVPAADTQPITVQAAGGGLHFTGAVVGMHARTE